MNWRKIGRVIGYVLLGALLPASLVGIGLLGDWMFVVVILMFIAFMAGAGFWIYVAIGRSE